jgi:hypothetical protein
MIRPKKKAGAEALDGLEAAGVVDGKGDVGGAGGRSAKERQENDGMESEFADQHRWHMITARRKRTAINPFEGRPSPAALALKLAPFGCRKTAAAGRHMRVPAAHRVYSLDS